VVGAVGSAASGARVRVAYAIGTRVGNAVVRNRCRRRLRGVFTEVDPATLPAGAYLVSAQPDVTALSYQELREHVERALKKINEKGGRR
jgi:ribonuclease P protein component